MVRRLLLPLFLCVAMWSIAPHSLMAEPLRWGRITNNPQKAFKKMRPMADRLVEVLAPHGITEVEFVFRENLKDMKAAMSAGEVDLIADTLFVAINLEKAGVATAKLVEWRDNTNAYHSVFFARKDSGIASVHDLKGKIVAFEDASSTSGFFLPQQALREAGFTLQALQWAGALPEVPQGVDVGYLFAQAERNIPLWVHEGRAHAGAFSSKDYHDDDHVPPAMRNDLQIIHTTKDYPRAILMLRSSLDPAMQEALTETLQRAHTDPELQKGMQKYKKVKQYEPISAAVRAEMDALAASLP